VEPLLSSPVPPAWRLPEGVNASLWEYTHSPRLALEEDTYFDGHPLLDADARALDERFVEPGPLIDLGCGAGRLSLRFARRGFPVVAVDLSQPMLDVVAGRAMRENLPISAVQANLCRLGCFPDASFRYAISMFSTLGMIRGPAARRRALAETFRILVPGGRFALHAHNLWLNLHDSQGRAWLFEQVWNALRGKSGFGDRRMTYRGIASLEVHLYRWNELRRDLKHAGFQIDALMPIDRVSACPIARPWIGHAIRAGGWLVFARRPS
jgi:SAM-dependent methyltransferase